jgi:SPX domain protein involved in polyphosphate accumulation
MERSKHPLTVDDPYDESRLFQTLKYRPYFDKLQVLKDKLSSITKEPKDTNRMKNLEAEFLEALNHFVADLNSFCTNTVTEIRESLNFITRKLSVEQKVESKIHSLLSDEVDVEALEIIRLDQFVQLMQDALLELTQRHDSIVGISSSAWFSARLQGEKFTNINFCALLLRLSEVYQGIREGLRVHPAPIRDSSSQYKTRTAKFWIRKSDVVKVKAMIVKHLPSRVWDEPDPNIPWEEITDSRKYTSIYLDSDKFDLYTTIRNEENGASQVRVEWYDDDEAHTVIERKIYKDWESNSTTNTSFPLKHKRLGPFFKGDWTYESDAKKLQKQLSPEQFEERKKIANEIQQVAKEYDLKPVLRVEYQRSGFQDNRSPELRIALYDDLVLTREKNGEGEMAQKYNCGS